MSATGDEIRHSGKSDRSIVPTSFRIASVAALMLQDMNGRHSPGAGAFAEQTGFSASASRIAVLSVAERGDPGVATLTAADTQPEGPGGASFPFEVALPDPLCFELSEPVPCKMALVAAASQRQNCWPVNSHRTSVG